MKLRSVAVGARKSPLAVGLFASHIGHTLGAAAVVDGSEEVVNPCLQIMG